MNHEQALLGAILSGAALPVDLPLDPGDFDQPAHEVIYRAAARVHDTGGKPTALTVAAALGHEESKRFPGGLSYLHTLMAEWAADDPAWLAEQVAAQAARRRLNSAALQIHQLASQDDGDRDEINERARQLVDDATDAHQKTGPRTVGEVMLEVLEAAENGRDPALSTPWPDLDRHIHGLMPGRLYVIGARPGVGKSIVATQLATHVANRHHLAAHMATLEMSAEEVIQRVLANDADVNLTKLETGQDLTDSDWQRIAESHRRIQDWPLYIEDAPAQSIATIRAAVRTRSRKERIGVVVIDYLGLLAPADRSVPRHEQIGAMTASLKIMARELQVPVVLCAQLNRASLSRADSTPTLGDLRESGSIEQDADAVILMHRPDMRIPEVEVVVAKVRNGPIGRFQLVIHGHRARMVSAATSPQLERIK